MGTQTTKAKQTSRKKTSRKKMDALATCPVGASGWCSYPFSAAQLQKRLKAKAEQEEQSAELATSGRSK